MSNPVIEELIQRYPRLAPCAGDIAAAFDLLAACYARDGIVYLCGNGGSAADADHIVGELMKSFHARRPLPAPAEGLIPSADPLDRLEGALRAVSLTGHPSLSTAFANDVAPELVFAQQVFGYGRPGDVLWGLSTSGNSRNIIQALRVAKARGLATIGLAGAGGGAMQPLCDACIRVPETETYKVQELHLPVYHALCRMLEQRFFLQQPGGGFTVI